MISHSQRSILGTYMQFKKETMKEEKGRKEEEGRRKANPLFLCFEDTYILSFSLGIVILQRGRGSPHSHPFHTHHFCSMRRTVRTVSSQVLRSLAFPPQQSMFMFRFSPSTNDDNYTEFSGYFSQSTKIFVFLRERKKER